VYHPGAPAATVSPLAENPPGPVQANTVPPRSADAVKVAALPSQRSGPPDTDTTGRSVSATTSALSTAAQPLGRTYRSRYIPAAVTAGDCAPELKPPGPDHS